MQVSAGCSAAVVQWWAFSIRPDEVCRSWKMVDAFEWTCLHVSFASEFVVNWNPQSSPVPTPPLHVHGTCTYQSNCSRSSSFKSDGPRRGGCAVVPLRTAEEAAPPDQACSPHSSQRLVRLCQSGLLPHCHLCRSVLQLFVVFGSSSRHGDACRRTVVGGYRRGRTGWWQLALDGRVRESSGLLVVVKRTRNARDRSRQRRGKHRQTNIYLCLRVRMR